MMNFEKRDQHFHIAYGIRSHDRHYILKIVLKSTGTLLLHCK
jgi:hypothetical protein